MRKAAEAGFTLLELIIALSLSAFVLVGIIQVSATMVRYQLNAGLKGSAGGSTILALGRMSRMLEDTTYMSIPATGTPQDYVAGCTNWSQLGNQRILATLNRGAAPEICPGAANNVVGFVFCRSGSNQLYLHYNCSTTCSIPAVTSGNCGAGVGTVQQIIGQRPGFYRHGSWGNIFYRVTGGVDLHYSVGYSTPTAAEPTPAFYRMDQRVMMNKAFNGTD
jgi:prepilin-type N-terminal cleavage/methylation domain-containing protein